MQKVVQSGNKNFVFAQYIGDCGADGTPGPDPEPEPGGRPGHLQDRPAQRPAEPGLMSRAACATLWRSPAARSGCAASRPSSSSWPRRSCCCCCSGALRSAVHSSIMRRSRTRSAIATRFVTTTPSTERPGVVRLSGNTVITQAKNLAVYGHVGGSRQCPVCRVYQTGQVAITDVGSRQHPGDCDLSVPADARGQSCRASFGNWMNPRRSPWWSRSPCGRSREAIMNAPPATGNDNGGVRDRGRGHADCCFSP